MINWISHWFNRFKEATPHTKFFVLNAVFYMLMMFITTYYSYERLPRVKSERRHPPSEATSIEQKR